MDYEILNRLMVKVTSELREFIPRNLFHPVGIGMTLERRRLSEEEKERGQPENKERYLSEEEIRGCLASGFAETLFYNPPKDKFLTDRQYVACELLIYLGHLISIETTDPQRPDVITKFLNSFKKFQDYFTEQEAKPFISLLEPDPEQSNSQVVKNEETPIIGIPKRKVMSAFQDIKWDYDHWGSNLANPSKALKECRISMGNKSTSALWNPISIGLYLLDKGEQIKKLDSIFTMELKDWTEEWKKKTDLMRD